MRSLLALVVIFTPAVALAQSSQPSNIPFLALSAVPLLLVFVTCFAKVLLTLLFLRAGLASQGIPPTSFLLALALALCALVMAPIAQEIYTRSESQLFWQSLAEGDLYQSLSTAGPALEPLQRFLSAHTAPDDLKLLQEIAQKLSATQSELLVQIPAFLLSELREALQLGIWVLVPFLVIDLSLGVLLYSLNFTQVEPRILAFPIKLMLLISTNGVALIAQTLLLSYAP